MSHQDRISDIVINHRTIKQVVDWLFPPTLFVDMRVRAGATWKPRMLAVAALLWAAADQENLGERFKQAQKIVKKVFRWQMPPGKTYQGFMKVLQNWHVRLLDTLLPQLRKQTIQVLPHLWKIAGYVVFATDGSCVELARTKSLEESYSPKKSGKKSSKPKGRGKGKTNRRTAKKRKNRYKKKTQSEASMAKKANSPQMWLTLLWHVGTGLPWCWRSGRSGSSEREQFTQMLQEIPEKSLITADAGFVGYDFWKTILDAGHHFVIRVGGNVTLLKGLGHARQCDHVVYLWPDKISKRQQPPLVLRLIVIHNGSQPVYLVTDLSKSCLSDSQSATIYSSRWGIEVFFRTLKQTFGRRKLRSRSSQNVALELDWSLRL